MIVKKKAFTKILTYIFFFQAVDQSFFCKPQKSALMLFSVNHGPIFFLLGLPIFFFFFFEKEQYLIGLTVILQ